MKYFSTIFMFLWMLSSISYSQKLYSCVGQSESYLVKVYGQPDYAKPNGNGYVYQYRGRESNENITYMIKNGKVGIAIQGFTGLTLKDARYKRDIMVLSYMGEGYKNNGSQSGMTIMKKGRQVLSVGYISNPDGTYAVLVTAY